MRTWPDCLAHFAMHAFRLQRAPTRKPFPASSVACIRQGLMQQDEQAFTCNSPRAGPEPPTRPDFPASAAPGTTARTPSLHKSLKLTVPRAQLRTPLPLNVAYIFGDTDAWSTILAPAPAPRAPALSSSRCVYQKRQ